MSPVSISSKPEIVDPFAQPLDKGTEQNPLRCQVWTVWWVAYSAESQQVEFQFCLLCCVAKCIILVVNFIFLFCSQYWSCSLSACIRSSRKSFEQQVALTVCPVGTAWVRIMPCLSINMINILLPKDFETFAFFGSGVPDIFNTQLSLSLWVKVKKPSFICRYETV